MRTSKTFIYAIMITALSCAAAGAATKIALRENVEMKSNVVRLGDVAEITSDDTEASQKLAALPLMPSPSRGDQRFLRKREIEDLLTAHGIDLRTLSIAGATQVTIHGSPATITPRGASTGRSAHGKLNRHAALLAGHDEADEEAPLDPDTAATLNSGLSALITSYLSKKTDDAGDCEVTCDVAERHLALLASATSKPVCRGGKAPWVGRQRFEISFTTADGSVKIPVYANVAPRSKPVVVTTRPIARGDVFTAADLELQAVDYVPTANERRTALDSIEKLIGMEARRPIPIGSIVFNDAVQSPVLVKRGDLITVSSQTSGIRVRTTARALQDRSHGELVQLESLDTKEKFDARVVGPREATIAAVAPSTVTGPIRPMETARR
jgi:flagella basal body P-ring formation protein FlgA